MRLHFLTLCLLGCGDHEFRDPTREFGPEVPAGAALHPVHQHIPTTLGVADTPVRDANGSPVGVACATCHGPDPETAWVADADAPRGAHRGVELRHGTLTCDFCHEPTDRTKLHLADGRTLELTEAMTLCAQCHGTQFRDYQAGAHGGMNGYWDRRRGPRDRNHCVDCHAPHTPRYEAVLPVFPPRDRYLVTDTPHAEGH